MFKYKIEKIHYRDIYGNLLWEEPMVFRRLYSVGQDFIINSITYIVRRVAVVDNIQHLNIEKHNQKIQETERRS